MTTTPDKDPVTDAKEHAQRSAPANESANPTNQQPTPPSAKPGGGVPVQATPVGATTGAPAELPPSSVAGRGMFGISGSGDTSGFGGLVRRRVGGGGSERPYGSYFDEVYDSLEEAFPGLDDAIEKVVSHMAGVPVKRVSSSDKDFVTDLGADQIIEYTTEKFEDRASGPGVRPDRR